MKIQIFTLIDQFKRTCPPKVQNSKSILSFIDKLKVELESKISKEGLVNKDDIESGIEDIITSHRGDKKGLQEFFRGLKRFIAQEKRTLLEMRFLNADIIDDPTERRLKIACYLHEPKSNAQIMEHFYINDKTVRTDLNALEEGMSFLGQEIKVQVVRENKKVRYVSTVHPIFLPLNLTEVYALTVGMLKLTSPDNPMFDIYEYLAQFVSDQLSDYAKKIINNSAKEADVNLPQLKEPYRGAYRDERTLIEGRKNAFGYMMKRGEQCTVEYTENDEIKTINGRMNFSKNNENIQGFDVDSGNETTTIKFSQLIRVIPHKYI